MAKLPPPKEFEVVLIRMPHKPNKVFKHHNKTRASRQAVALSDIHACPLIVTETGYIVNAVDFYKPRMEKPNA